jgi:hypothetical protein
MFSNTVSSFAGRSIVPTWEEERTERRMKEARIKG